MVINNMKNLFYKEEKCKNKIVDENFFLDCDKCRKLFINKDIFIFGTGVDAERAMKELSEYANILAYIDNNRHGKERYFYEKRIIDLECCLKQRNKQQPIVVATYRFAMEISSQLSDIGLELGKDFFVWDEMHLFCHDVNTKKYIDFLNNIWKKDNKCNNKSKVLIPFENRHALESIIFAYTSNYFAQKWNADIYAYFRLNTNLTNASEVVKDIYKAFNVKNLIDPSLDGKQQNEVDKILDAIWCNLFTWEDWKNITIYGICFGTTIIRELLRIYIPSFDLRDQKMYLFLKKAISTIVFWHDYIFTNDIKVILMADGVNWEGYIRDIAITKGIPVYAVINKMAKLTLDFYDGTPYPYFKEMWKQLTLEEQKYGINWAKEHIEKRLCGGTEEVLEADKTNFAFAEKKKEFRVLEKNEKIKIMICPHIFEEDCIYCGEQIFDNNYFSWLCHLGELSNKTPEYDWYLKMHPSSQRRDFIIIDMLLKKYSQIKKIPGNVSPIQLKEEGIDYALTVYGSIGHEYPEIGIQVINAGNNPHSAFNFTWNPKTKEEYDYLIMNLDKLKKKVDKEGLYQFYSLNYLFYDWDYIPYRSLFFKNPVLAMDRLELESHGKRFGTWLYKEYMKEWTKKRHENILIQMENIFEKLDNWRPNVLYKKKDCMKIKEEED